MARWASPRVAGIASRRAETYKSRVNTILPSLAAWTARLVRDSFRVFKTLLRIMLPVILCVKIAKETGLITYLASLLTPLMSPLGLPGPMALVWGTGMLSNIYGGLAAFQAVSADMGALTQAQTTTVALMLLIAHALPLEGQVTRACGVSFFGQVSLRVASAYAAGLGIHWFCQATGALAGPAFIVLPPPAPDPTLPLWALGEVKNLLLIYAVITALMALMRVFDLIGVTRLVERLLLPMLKLLGIGSKAATLTVVGLVMGLSYGGGLIIHDVKAGVVPRRDVLPAISLMSLCHSLLEDTLLFTLIGASLWGTMGWRLVFSLAVVSVIARLRPALPRRDEGVATAS